MTQRHRDPYKAIDVQETGTNSFAEIPFLKFWNWMPPASVAVLGAKNRWIFQTKAARIAQEGLRRHGCLRGLSY